MCSRKKNEIDRSANSLKNHSYVVLLNAKINKAITRISKTKATTTVQKAILDTSVLLLQKPQIEKTILEIESPGITKSDITSSNVVSSSRNTKYI